jgi:LL-diaminopimelate aminotransferase
LVNINKNFENLIPSYLFAEVASKVSEFKEKNPGMEVISLGIGDVTLPLAPIVVDAIKNAADEMGEKETFRGYGPYEGYEFLRSKIKDYYSKNNANIEIDEIFVGDGAKNDLGAILDLFEETNTALIPDPVYPAYVDSSVIKGNLISYVSGNRDNGFLPTPPDFESDIIYICSPNNPTGAVYDYDGLKSWVDYAVSNKAVILFDAAYERFIADKELPRSIFCIEGARECAIEFCSLSKTAGFTGTRLGYTVIPRELKIGSSSLRDMWARRQASKYNGTSYIIQKAAEAVYSEEGLKQIDVSIDYYRKNAEIMSSALEEMKIEFYGGKNSPYIWFASPDNASSWETFDILLSHGVVCTPGSGFGENGEGFCRLTTFGNRDDVVKATKRLRDALSD